VAQAVLVGHALTFRFLRRWVHQPVWHVSLAGCWTSSSSPTSFAVRSRFVITARGFGLGRVGGEPGCLDGSRCWVSRQVASEEGQLSTGGIGHRSMIGHEYPCVPKAADDSPGAFEGPGSGGNSGAEATTTDLTEPKPTEARASNGFAGGNSQRLVHPVCAEGGGRFAGCVRGARFWGQLRGGSHDDGPDGAETDRSAHIEWVRGGQLPRTCSNPLVFEKRSSDTRCPRAVRRGQPQRIVQ
jgi:hypothetical protein